jgi:hypothetical protein
MKYIITKNHSMTVWIDRNIVARIFRSIILKENQIDHTESRNFSIHRDANITVAIHKIEKNFFLFFCMFLSSFFIKVVLRKSCTIVLLSIIDWIFLEVFVIAIFGRLSFILFE